MGIQVNISDDRREATCAGKERLSFARADRIARKMRRRGKRGDEAMVPYKCPYCQGWHVGSRPC